MPLPFAIDDLRNGKTVEWERRELQAGWNPLAVVGAGRCSLGGVGSNPAGYERSLNLVRQ